LINDKQAVEKLISILQPLDDVIAVTPSMGSEDFSFYTQKATGAMIALGIYNEDKGIIWPNHHPKFDVDEAVLWKGAAAYALLGTYS
ncbi:MAG: M20/M25/M40 family metallo-hydrolase, partial [Candidatus Hodarchaeota archaeon]